MQITYFTVEELNKLAQVCDIAIKAGGIPVAQEVLPLVAKMQKIVQEIQTPPADSSQLAG